MMAERFRLLLFVFALTFVACSRGKERSKVSGPSAVDVPRARFVGSTARGRWEHWRVERDGGPTLDTYAVRTEGRRPLVVMLQGSGCRPLFSRVKTDQGERGESSLLFVDAVAVAEPAVHFLTVEKGGVTSFGPGVRPRDERPSCTALYEQTVSKEERVRDVVDAIRAFAVLPWVSSVVVAGHSEGADVAAGVAGALGTRSVMAVGLFAGASPTQLYDAVAAARRKDKPEEVRGAFDDILWLTGPEAGGRFRGHSIERWRSFAVRSSPLDDLRDVRVPTFVAHGSADPSAAIEGADLFVTEIVRRRDRPVYYLSLRGLDHGYVDGEGHDFAPAVFARFLTWALAPTKPTALLDLPPSELTAP